MNEFNQSYRGSGNNYKMGKSKQEQLDDLERLRNEVNMTDDEYNVVKDIINEEYDPYYSSRYKGKQDTFLSSGSPFNELILKLLPIIVIALIVISLFWYRSSIREKREKHPFSYHSASVLCIMNEKEFKLNIKTADSVILNDAIKEFEGRLKHLNSLDNDALHIKFEKKQLNERLLWLKEGLSELKK